MLLITLNALLAKEAVKVRELWEESGTKTLRKSKRPAFDVHDGRLVNDVTPTENISKRVSHLAQVLELLQKIYFENKDLFGDRFLAFVGNEVG